MATYIRWSIAAPIWRSRPPLKCKIFGWLAVRYCHGLQDQTVACFTSLFLQEECNISHILAKCVCEASLIRLCASSLKQWWLADREQMQKSDKCSILWWFLDLGCSGNKGMHEYSETCENNVVQCGDWAYQGGALSLALRPDGSTENLEDWWFQKIEALPYQRRQHFSSWWWWWHGGTYICLEWNNRIFNSRSSSMLQVCVRIVKDFRAWRMAETKGAQWTGTPWLSPLLGHSWSELISLYANLRPFVNPLLCIPFCFSVTYMYICVKPS